MTTETEATKADWSCRKGRDSLVREPLGGTRHFKIDDEILQRQVNMIARRERIFARSSLPLQGPLP